MQPISGDQQPQTILAVGCTGGLLTLEGILQPEGSWSFRLIRDEGMLGDLMPGEFTPDELHSESERVDSWEGALALLDRYSWASLHPVTVHPTFAQRILAAIRVRLEGSRNLVQRWEALTTRR